MHRQTQREERRQLRHTGGNQFAPGQRTSQPVASGVQAGPSFLCACHGPRRVHSGAELMRPVLRSFFGFSCCRWSFSVNGFSSPLVLTSMKFSQGTLPPLDSPVSCQASLFRPLCQRVLCRSLQKANGHRLMLPAPHPTMHSSVFPPGSQLLPPLY